MEKVKAALIGCGGRNGVHYQKLSVMEDVDLIGFCDTDVSRAQAMADKYGSGKVYDNYKSMLDDIKPDVIFIAVPPHQHGEIENAIIDLGIPFQVEKPMALDLAVAEQILARIEEKGLLTNVGFQDRWQNLTETMKSFCEEHTPPLSFAARGSAASPEYGGGDSRKPAAVRSLNRTSTCSTSCAFCSANPNPSTAQVQTASSTTNTVCPATTSISTTPLLS